jgi:cysteine-S-conjugate beta-lyase
MIDAGDSPLTLDFDTPVDRRGTSSEKWDKYAGRDILPLWVADMDFRSPDAVISALQQRVAHGVFGYTDAPRELVEVVCAMLWDLYSWSVEPDWIVWLPGLVSGINVACRAVGCEGDEIMTAIPVYPPFLSAPGFAYRQVKTIPLIDTGNRWMMDLDTLRNNLTPRTSLFLLCNPHNPVGRAFDAEELSALAEHFEGKDRVICSDEIHCGLILDANKRHIPLAVLSPEIAERTITLMAPSKTFNIPGLGCSFAVISHRPLRKRFRQAMAGIVPPVNVLGFTAALAAYRDSSTWHAALLNYLRDNSLLVEEAISRLPGLSMHSVEATYLAWIDTRAVGLKDPEAFFENAGVGLSDGKYFGQPGFVRLNFGCPRSILKEALKRMSQAVDNWTPGSRRLEQI